MKKRLFFIGALCMALVSCSGGKSEMDKFIDDLMGKMTVEEKIGQLNLPVAGDIVTGQAKSSNVSERIRKGEVGGLFADEEQVSQQSWEQSWDVLADQGDLHG